MAQPAALTHAGARTGTGALGSAQPRATSQQQQQQHTAHVVRSEPHVSASAAAHVSGVAASGAASASASASTSDAAPLCCSATQLATGCVSSTSTNLNLQHDISRQLLNAGHADHRQSVFTSFHTKPEDLPGYAAHSVLNLRSHVSKKEEALGSRHDFDNFELGRASNRAGDRHIAVGTDSPEAQQHFLSIIDGAVMNQAANAESVMCYTRTKGHISDLRWLNDETLLAAVGKGDLQLFKFDAERKTVEHHADMNGVAASYIREVAINPLKSNNIAFGGFDQTLNFLDLSRPDAPYTLRLDVHSVISTVKWAPFLGAAYVGCGLDDGKFYLFDSRSKSGDAVRFITTHKEDLFTHERYNENGLLLGFGDGEMQHFDLRNVSRVLHTVQDPYVEAIGGIEFNDDAQAFVVSGFTDFTVWDVLGGAEGVPTVHSHSVNGEGIMKGDGYLCSASWYDNKTVLAADNVGAVSLFIQDFE